MSDTIKKQGIINLNNYSSNSYTTVVLSESKVAFFEEEEDAAFQLFLLCFVYGLCCIIETVSDKFPYIL